MKKCILFMCLWTGIVFGQQRAWHVKPYSQSVNQSVTAASGSDGLTAATGWNIQFALNGAGGAIQPGDIVWLHNGDYKGQFTSNLSGASANYITVSSYPGEWARLDGNIFTYVTPPASLPQNPDTALPSTTEQENATYADDEENTGAVLTVKGRNVQYINFEVTALGALNRLGILDKYGVNCMPSNGFHKYGGIEHSTATRNKFSNLVIRNLPGPGIGSWKETLDSEIYGCVIYNNGYIANQKDECSATSYFVAGKGPGIYTQNRSDTQYRSIQNNLILNNYDSGLFIWSSTNNPGFDYLQNYNVNQNMFVNNGGPQRDETANALVRSTSLTEYNHPKNINLTKNLFYINNRSSYISGIDVRNGIGINMTDNYIIKGTAGIKSQSNKDFYFHNNTYFGKRLQYLTSQADYLANSWSCDYNKYFTRSDSSNMFEIVVGSTRYTLSQFQSLYNDELNSVRFGNTDFTDSAGNLLMYNNNATLKTVVVQNKYNPNIFYVTIFSPRSDLASNANIAVNFSSYGIANGKNYEIRDVQNYFGAAVGTGSYSTTTNTISFPMTLTNIELPTGQLGIDYTTTPEHSYRDLGTFVLEFKCAGIAYDLTKQNISNDASNIYLARNNIFFGPSYTTANTAVINATAAKQILISGDSYIKPGTAFLAKIENVCPDLAYVGENAPVTSRMSDNGETKFAMQQQSKLVLYPNPSSGVFQIEAREKGTIDGITIFDTNSRLIFQENYENKDNVKADISAYPKGVYFVKVEFKDGSFETKSIIKE